MLAHRWCFIWLLLTVSLSAGAITRKKLSVPVLNSKVSTESTTTTTPSAIEGRMMKLENMKPRGLNDSNSTLVVPFTVVETTTESTTSMQEISTTEKSHTSLLEIENKLQMSNSTISLNEMTTIDPFTSSATDTTDPFTSPTTIRYDQLTESSVQGNESAAVLKEALKCSVPHFVETYETVNSQNFQDHPDALSIGFHVQTLDIKFLLPSDECFGYLTGLWIRIDDDVGNTTKSDQPWMVPRQCLQRNGKEVSLVMPAQPSGGSCNFHLRPLIECRTYSVKVVADFLTLTGRVWNKQFIVPPKGVGSALGQFQSSASSSGLNASWIMRSDDCNSILSSVQLKIYQDATTDSATSSLTLPKSCLFQKVDHGTGVSLPSSNCSVPWQSLDKCRRYRMTFEAEFASQWKSEPSSWEVFTAESGSLAPASVNQNRCSQSELYCYGRYHHWYGRTNDYYCMHSNTICDQNNNYYSGYDYCDERHCIYNSDCTGKFRCGRRCLPQHLLCDGQRDCEDGSDEVDCGSCCHLLSSHAGSFPPETRQRPAPCTYSISVEANLVIWLSFSLFESENPIKVYDGPYSTSRLVFDKTGNTTQTFDRMKEVQSTPYPRNETFGNYYSETISTRAMEQGTTEYNYDEWGNQRQFTTAQPTADRQGIFVPNSIRSSGNNLFVELPAASRVRAYYTTVDANGPFNSFANGCGGYIKDEGLIMSSTEGDSECWWYIETSSKNHTIQLENMKADQLSCSLKVYDGWTPGGVLISNQEDESAARTNVYSLGNRIRIQFNSTSSAPYFWKISSVYTPECWTQLNDTTGTISSPDYPRSYPGNVDCRWQITAEPGSRIRLLFAFFDLENNFDFLQIYDGSSYYSPSLLVASGTLPPLKTVTSSSNNMLIRLSSNQATSGYGFLAIYTTF